MNSTTPNPTLQPSESPTADPPFGPSIIYYTDCSSFDGWTKNGALISIADQATCDLANSTCWSFWGSSVGASLTKTIPTTGYSHVWMQFG